MPRININTIKSLSYNGKNQRVFDDALKGFGIEIHKDSMSFIIQYRNKYNQQRLLTLGRVGTLAPDEAREIAKKKFADLAYGIDPAEQRRDEKSIMTLAELCDWYLQDDPSPKKPTTIAHNVSAVKHHIKPLIGTLPIKAINCSILEKFIRDVESGDKIRRRAKGDRPHGYISIRGGVSAASHSARLLRTIFNFAIRHEKLDKNPMSAITPKPYNKRDVFLNYDEIRALGRLFAIPQVAALHKIAIDALTLILMTGCRKNEILTLKWDYVDFDNQCFRFPDTKTGKQTRPFGIAALRHLQKLHAQRTDSPFVFPATKESRDGHLMGLYKMFMTMLALKDENDKLIFDKKGLMVHSLRHSFASISADMGYSDLITGALLGHSSGGRGTTSIYTHAVDKSLIAAANAVSEKIENALGDNPSA